MNTLFVSQNPSFTSSSTQIRDAQWVCQKVRSFPHISTTHIAPSVEELADKNIELYDRFMDKKPFEHFVANTPKEAKLVRIFSWRNQLVDRITRARDEWYVGTKDNYKRVVNILNQFKYDRLGNCGEDAYLATAILKLNGIDNAYVAKIEVDNYWIDHVICVFNRDGSVFDGKSLKNTIIIDPWVGDADFAQNMFLKYKGQYKKFMCGIKSDSEIKLSKSDYVLFSQKELKVLQEKFKYLLYPENKRGFMQKNNPNG